MIAGGRIPHQRIPSAVSIFPTSTSTACWPAAPAPVTTEWHDNADVTSLREEARSLEESGAPIRLRVLAQRAGLDELDVDLLLVAVAPDLDSRFERLYGYLNDDVTRRRATIGLSLELGGASAWSAEARSRFSPDAPLTSAGLVVVEEPERPFLSRSLRVPDRVVAHLLGDDRADPAVAALIRPPVMLPARRGFRRRSERYWRAASRLVYLRERPGASAPAIAAAALEAAGLRALTVDLDHLSPSEAPEEVARTVGREALLSSAGVVAGPVEALLSRAAGLGAGASPGWPGRSCCTAGPPGSRRGAGPCPWSWTP